ncbi:BamA/TamA family outer membrane protein [Chitinophaga horti]|uniref:BamA/TamA family outer membrane protein n=1 Tax=Chitinophaga horti TaxID=2920382 RepID=A0ABY6J646_9BACT|nr:BamA/TamA family outer membrane protein [Chitinophaga horti]UYQ93749.1 BamA/TamA family outer membrane protein [Chitinophaga horti]
MQKPFNSAYNICFTCLLICACIFISACSNTKYLQKDQRLFTGSEMTINGEITSTEKQELKSALSSKSLMLQQPNTKFLGMRTRVWLYNQKYNEKKSNWFWHLVLAPRNLEEPAIYDSAKTRESVDRMTTYLNNQGFFYAQVKHEEEVKNQRVSLKYEVNTGKNFVIDKVIFAIPDSAIRNVVLENQTLSLLKKNTVYKGETLNAERERLTRVLRNAGYYKFPRDLIEFELDTLNKSLFKNALNPFENLTGIFNNRDQSKLTLDVEVRINKPTDSSSTEDKLYYIDSIYVYPDLPLAGNLNDSTLKETQRRAFTVRSYSDNLRPGVLARSILIRPGNKYSIDSYNGTINKLYDLNLFQFITLQYREKQDSLHKLDAYIQMTQKKRQELGLTADVTTSSDYFVGSSLSLNYRNYNINRAANELQVSLKGGVEIVRNDGRFALQTREYGIESNLTFPRFITPFFRVPQSNRSTAKTRVSAGFSSISRVEKFVISTLSSSFGYEWNESIYKRWILRPITLNYVGTELTKVFRDSVVNLSPYLVRSFEPAFIGGESFTFIYTNNDALHTKRNSFVRVNFEESGLWLKGLNSAIYGISSKNTSLEMGTNVKISQFVKLDADYRIYWNRPKASTVARAYIGVGLPYGQSDVLPYIRQYTSGGPNSIRAWRLRTLGPGSYVDTSATAAIFPDQTGDMKLEANLEYRFDILRLFNGTINLKGATFLDVGNIWMLKRDTVRPGAEFRFSKLYNDLAIGTGAGLRLDFSFFVVRFDWGLPLKKPFRTDAEDKSWYISKWDLGSGTWRKENIIWNVAIGYPF